MSVRVVCHEDGWQGWRALDVAIAPRAWAALAAGPTARASRHARTIMVDTDDGRLWVKLYPGRGWRYAARAARMHDVLTDAGFRVPTVVMVARHGQAGLLVTQDVRGLPLTEAIAHVSGQTKRRLLAHLGDLVGRLHGHHFVAGDLVPSNVLVDQGEFVLLDHDRTRRHALLAWWGARRNLVQLGRFVMPGVTLTDRVRVLRAYADRLRLARPHWHRLADWLVRRIQARRCAIDGIDVGVATRVGFRALMQSGGPCDRVGEDRR